MSDLMTPWHVIEKRIVAAAEAEGKSHEEALEEAYEIVGKGRQ